MQASVFYVVVGILLMSVAVSDAFKCHGAADNEQQCEFESCAYSVPNATTGCGDGKNNQDGDVVLRMLSRGGDNAYGDFQCETELCNNKESNILAKTERIAKTMEDENSALNQPRNGTSLTCYAGVGGKTVECKAPAICSISRNYTTDPFNKIETRRLCLHPRRYDFNSTGSKDYGLIVTVMKYNMTSESNENDTMNVYQYQTFGWCSFSNCNEPNGALEKALHQVYLTSYSGFLTMLPSVIISLVIFYI